MPESTASAVPFPASTSMQSLRPCRVERVKIASSAPAWHAICLAAAAPAGGSSTAGRPLVSAGQEVNSPPACRIPRYSDEVKSATGMAAARSPRHALLGRQSQMQPVCRNRGVHQLCQVDASGCPVRVDVPLDLRTPVAGPVCRLLRVVDDTPVAVADSEQNLLTIDPEIACVGDGGVAPA